MHVGNIHLEQNMAQLSDRLQRLAPSATLAMSQKSSEMKAQGIDVINMSVGEPDFNTPDHIKQAAKMAIDENYSRYSPVPGYPDLRQAIARKLERENHLHYQPSEILVSNGAKQSVCNTIMALVNDGEEVIIPTPYWVSYPQMVLLAGGKPVFVEAGFEQNFKMTAAQLEAAITPKTRMIILCSPSNPTGSVYNKEELKALADVILKHEDLFVLADEIYEHINYIGKHESIAQFEGMKERSIIVNGVSKAYAMTGWRIGYIAAPEWIVKGCNKLQGQYTSGPCSVSQKAAEFAYTSSQECVEEMRKAFERRRDLTPRPDCETGQGDSRTGSQRPRGRLLPVPQVQQLLWQEGYRRLCCEQQHRPGPLSAGERTCGHRRRRCLWRPRLLPHELCHQRRKHCRSNEQNQGGIGSVEIKIEEYQVKSS